MLKEKETLRLSVKSLKEMLNKGTLKSDTSVQRNFIYNSADTGRVWIKDSCDSSKCVKRSTAVVETILQGGMLPEIVLFENEDTGELTIHDGKQRILSAIGYLDGVVEDSNGNFCSYNWLDTNDASTKKYDTVAAFEFRVVIYTGNTADEETSFEAINTRAVPLTQYETLRSLYYGKWLTGFEAYITGLSETNDFYHKINRGEQAYMLLLFLCNIISLDKDKVNLCEADRYDQLKKELSHIGRDTEFDPDQYHFRERLNQLERYCRLSGTSTSAKAFRPWTAYQVVNYLFNHCSETERTLIFNTFSKKVSVPNDIGSWKEGVYRTFIKETLAGKDLDGRRSFTADERMYLVKEAEKASPTGKAYCADCGAELTLKTSTVDHIIPWSEGGKTVLSNARLLCNSCNAAKGRRMKSAEEGN